MWTWGPFYNDFNLFLNTLSLILIFLNVSTTYSQLIFVSFSMYRELIKVRSINWLSIFFFCFKVWTICIPFMLWTDVTAGGIYSSISAVGSNKPWIFWNSGFCWPSSYDDVGGRSVVSKSFSILLVLIVLMTFSKNVVRFILFDAFSRIVTIVDSLLSLRLKRNNC